MEKIDPTHGTHYEIMSIKPWQVQAAMLQNFIDYVTTHHKEPMPVEPFIKSLMSIKYVMRAGMKQGEGWEKDIEKAINYLNAAASGQFLPIEEVSNE